MLSRLKSPKSLLIAGCALVLVGIAVGLLAGALTNAPAAGVCTTTVSTNATIVSAVASAAPGDTVCVADGTYTKVTLSATNAPPGVTVRAEHPGLAAITGGASLNGSYLTLAQFNVTGEIDLMPGSSHMTIDHNRITGGYMGVNLPTSSTQVNDAKITGNKFVGPFGEDAIRANRYHDADGDGVGLLVQDNEFTNIRENGNHSDCLQAVWVGDHMVYRGNYLHDNQCQGLFIKDQASTVDTVIAEDNLMLRNNAGCGPPATSCGEPSIFQLFGPMTNLQVKHNTIWTPGGGGSQTTLRDPGWAGPRVFDSNVISRPWSDTSSPFGSGYVATNNVSSHAPEGTWPSAGFTSVAAPAFANPTADDYRTNDGRGVTWAPADKVFGPGGSAPPADTTPPTTAITLPSPPDGTSTSASIAFTGTDNVAVDHFQTRIDTGAWTTDASPKAYSGLAVGTHTVDVRAVDAAGNMDASPATATWTISAPSSVFVRDTFTGAAGTLAAHIGEVGSAWTVHPAYSDVLALSNSNRVRSTSTSNFGLDYASGVPATANYTVDADLVVKSLNGQAGVTARTSTSAATFYTCHYYANTARVELYKFVAGQPTLLRSARKSLTVGSTYPVRLSVSGPSIGCSIGGTTANATDAAITYAGRVGVRIGGRSAGNTVALHIDNVVASNP